MTEAQRMTDTIAEAKRYFFELRPSMSALMEHHVRALIALAERGSTQDVVDERNEYQSRWLASEGDKARLKEQLAEQRGVVMPEEPSEEDIQFFLSATDAASIYDACRAYHKFRAHLLAQQGEKPAPKGWRVSWANGHVITRSSWSELMTFLDCEGGLVAFKVEPL